MGTTIEREKLLEEVKRIPDDKLAEVYAILHYYRLGVESTQQRPADVLQYAGSWADMPADEFEDFIQDVQVRRQQAFSERRKREAYP
jgi:hypothetical protein